MAAGESLELVTATAIEPRVPRTIVERLALLPANERLRFIARMDDEALVDLMYDWRVWARPEQLPPEDGAWTHWGIMAGRGAGKTRSAAEFITDEVESGEHIRTGVHIVGRSAGDVRKTMIEGESGLLAVAHPDFYPTYEPSKKSIVWPNGTVGLLFNATEPEELRGPQCSLYWADEIGAWKRASDTWDNLMFGFRLGRRARGVFTTTPRPIQLVKELAATTDGSIAWAPTMTTYDNAANLAMNFIQTVVRKYQGTRLGRQELLGELLLDMPGALWNLAMIDDERWGVAGRPKAPRFEDLARIVVAIDPAVSTGEDSNETGIIVVARDHRPVPHFYVLLDLSGRWTAIEWARKAVQAFRDHRADRIVAEVNNGGDLVEAQLRIVDSQIPYTAVHASRGKFIRAEPVAALYEQKRVHHVGMFGPLEDQMVTFLPDSDRDDGDSPDRVDALVWALTELSDVKVTPLIPGSSSQRTLR